MPRLAFTHAIACIAAAAGAGLALSRTSWSAELRGTASVGSSANHVRSDEFTEGMDKSPFGTASIDGRIALRVDAHPFGNIVAGIVADADSRRDGVVDIQEAWIGWNPVPQSPWRTRLKAGAFFPVTNLEIGYDSVGWDAERTISSAAINSWLGEETRVIGVELTQQWRGAMIDSPHTVTAKVGVFGANDPAGTELAWRGWNLGGRVTGLFQNLRLPDLPVYRPDGAVPGQTRNVKVFREIDDRVGMYVALGYGHDEWLDFSAMHYDNRGDPLRLAQGQYAWHTRFDHLGVRLLLKDDWELLAQGMLGRTRMGPDAVNVDFSSWYLLLSHGLGPGLATLRHDHFQTTDRDLTPGDANGESGRAWSLAYSVPLHDSLTLVTEVTSVVSTRAARSLIGEAPRQSENSLSLELRLSF